MIKRAVIAALLGVGCDVLDLRSAPVPVARHFIRASGAVGAINVRKLPGNSRVTLLEMLDADGAYLDKAFERKVENVFFREDFRRTDPDDLGEIEFASRAVEEYQSDFYRALETWAPAGQRRPIRLVCDFGYSALASILPPMFDRLEVEAVSLNSFNNAKMAPRTPEQVAAHLDNVRHIVGTLGYDLGVLFTEEGERITCVDDQGRALSGSALAGILGGMVAARLPGARATFTVTAPTRLVGHLTDAGLNIERAKVDPPSLFRATHDPTIAFGADDSGGFIFPALHVGFDGAFALSVLMSLLSDGSEKMSDLADALPEFAVLHDVVPCGWEAKGAAMRRLAETYHDADLTDGIKVSDGEDWMLALPDMMEPWFHLYAEGATAAEAESRLDRFRREVETIVGEAS
jgi:mannose-1-phosphate guanylyltransferase/phosphomannomutase